jgi:putative ABC transport system permease protein
MMSYLTYALQLTLRNRRRTLTYLFGLVLAVGLFSGILFFVDASANKMTQTAIAPVVVDMQVRSTLAHPDMTPVRTALEGESFVTHVEPVITADFASLSVPISNQVTPAGKLFVLQPSYYNSFEALRILSGDATSSGVLISQTAANDLGLSVGDSVAINFDQLATPYVTKITGIVDPTGAYFLFASTDPNQQGEYKPVPYDVFISPELWEADLAVSLTNPPVPTDPNAKPIAAQKPLYELHVGTNHNLLPSDPTKASIFVDTLRRRMEKQFPGEIVITNNLADSIQQAKKDVLWAKLLFLFLGMPGVALAAYLSKYATDLLTGPQRQEIGLLRARGATPRQIMLAMGIASFFIALVGTVLGLIVGLGTTTALFGLGAIAPAALSLYSRSILYAFVAGLLLTGAATFLPIHATLRQEISHERRQAEHEAKSPFWARTYLDVVTLIIAGVIFWTTRTGGGFKPAGTEGASLSLGFFVFLGPFFLWVGLTLLLNRLLAGGVSHAAGVIQQILRRIFGDLGYMAGRSITRRAPKIASAVIIVSLALSFGTSLSIFIHTYQVQKAVDARFGLGSDIKLTVASGLHQQTTDFAKDISRVPGVAAVAPVERLQAYVGSSQQTVFGIDPQSYTLTTEPADSFFIDMNAAQAMQDLANVPNGVLVSQELANSYDIRLGDPVIIRLPRTASADSPMIEIRLQTVGIIRFFPTAQQDDFLVMNLSFMQSVTHNDKISYFLIRTSDAPHDVAIRLQDTLGTQVPMKTEDIDTAILALGNSMTSLNLQGLGSIEQGYSVIIISLGLSIFLLSMIYERAKELGAMRAVGGSITQIGRILWSESLTVGVLSLLIGSIIGLILGGVFVSLLKVLYTIPPAGMNIPWGALFALLVLIVLGMALATLSANRRLARMEIAQVLREL